METLFISDIHLDETRPEIIPVFLGFLYEKASQADALYILGDLFELWIGDDNQTEFNQMIIEVLKKLTDMGVPIYFMRGNHDFFIGKSFSKMTGIQLLKDPALIDLYGTPILLMHGDLLCTQDTQYQITRKILQNPISKFLFLLQPLSRRKRIADYYHKKSQYINLQKTHHTQRAIEKTINKMMLKYNARYLIHGHTHLPAIYHFMLNEKTAVRTVLGPWKHHGSVLTCKPDETQGLSFQLQSIL